MQVCPTCGTTYPHGGVVECIRDGARLVDAREYAAQDPLAGLVLGSRYRIERCIGQGGMGSVYRATQVGLDRPVAVKILNRESSWDPEVIRRFEREARSTSLLSHPNTVRVIDYGHTDGGLAYLVMELLHGESLGERLDREGFVEPPEAVYIVQQVLGSLAEAHQKGIVHRDMKPDNIFLVQVDGHSHPMAKVLDFGIAKTLHGDRRTDTLVTQVGTVFGTPRYMSPEQAQGKPLDGRTDLYSVGAVLYEMITGRAPFTDEDAVVVMAKHIKEPPKPPRKLAPDRPIPQSLERAVMCALKKSPDKRFDSAEQFALQLAACLPEVEAAALASRTTAAATRHGVSPWKLALAGLAAGCLIVAGLWAHRLYQNTASAEARGPRSALAPLPGASGDGQPLRTVEGQEVPETETGQPIEVQSPDVEVEADQEQSRPADEAPAEGEMVEPDLPEGSPPLQRARRQRRPRPSRTAQAAPPTEAAEPTPPATPPQPVVTPRPSKRQGLPRGDGQRDSQYQTF